MNAKDSMIAVIGVETEDSDTDGAAFLDRFEDERSSGAVVGSAFGSGRQRLGVDRESILGIDNGALRIPPLLKTGWGRAGIAYGPYRRSNGLAFGVFMLNGHNTSQAEPIPDGLRPRLARWVAGTEAASRLQRMQRFLGGRQRRLFWRRLLQWIRTGTRFHHVHALDQNLAVGWFSSTAPADPLQQGNAFVMHALGPECGDLRVRVGRDWQQAVRGLQNIPVFYFVVLREHGAAYYAASLPGVPGLAPCPAMRPLAVDRRADEPELFAGVHQSVLGQIGFRAESRVYATQVAHLRSYGHWYGSAHGADGLAGRGPLVASAAQVGGSWSVSGAALTRSDAGTVADGFAVASLTMPGPSGLVSMLVDATVGSKAVAALIWRRRDNMNYWVFEAGRDGCRLALRENGQLHSFPTATLNCLAPNAPNIMQVADDGKNIRLSLNGTTIYGSELSDSRLADESGVGFSLSGEPGMAVRDFEAHPRVLPIPSEFDLGACWTPQPATLRIGDQFDSPRGDLDGRTTPIGTARWSRIIGAGNFDVADRRVRVRATVDQPCPGRTAYAVDWKDPTFADVSVRITPPGIERGHREKGRGGLIFWQSPDCYVTLSVFMDDWYGTSIAAFFQVDGFEELYDAVWTNVGKRIHWGVPYDFRVVFEHGRFLVFIDGEPVLQRSLSDIYPDWTVFSVAKVGLVANWEWGNDTGSAFEDFRAGGPE